jgi:hypothetical protein
MTMLGGDLSALEEHSGETLGQVKVPELSSTNELSISISTCWPAIPSCGQAYFASRGFDTADLEDAKALLDELSGSR